MTKAKQLPALLVGATPNSPLYAVVALTREAAGGGFSSFRREHPQHATSTNTTAITTATLRIPRSSTVRRRLRAPFFGVVIVHLQISSPLSGILQARSTLFFQG